MVAGLQYSYLPVIREKSSVKPLYLYAAVGTGIFAAIAIAIIVNPTFGNHPPRISLSSEKQVLAGTNIELAAEEVVDEDGDPLNFNWVQVSGDSVYLLNHNTTKPSFSIAPAPNARTLEFQLQVSDGKITRPSTIKVIVLPNKAPVADAGTDLTVNKGSEVVLNGSKSVDPENKGLVYTWKQVLGPAVVISKMNSAAASFVAPSFTNATELTFQLVVNDLISDSKPDTVKVLVRPNKGPVANAGPDLVLTNHLDVKLNSTASSDPENDKLLYRWVQTSGPIVKLSDRYAPDPTFTPPSVKSDKVLTFQLIVNDGSYDSKPDSVKITVKANRAPVAVAGPDLTVPSAAQITLNATASSDLDNDTLTYRWNQSSGVSVKISDPTAKNPTFKAPTILQEWGQILTFRLIVSDGTYDSKPDYVKITVVGKIPVANAGANQTAKGGSLVTLDGSKSFDPDRGNLLYSWSQTAGPSVQLSDSLKAKPTFVAPQRGDQDKLMTFQLIVSDKKTSSLPDFVTVTVPANKGPVANAGPDAKYKEGAEIILDGSNSTDPDGDKLTYQWKQISGPKVSIKYSTYSQAVFNSPTVVKTETLKFELTVSDGLVSKKDVVQITIRAD